MLPEHMREAFWTKVSKYFQTEDEGMKKAALWLQDAGHADEEIIIVLRLAWNVGYWQGIDEERG